MGAWRDARCLASGDSVDAHTPVMWGPSALAEGHTANQLLLLPSGILANTDN